MIKSKYEWEYHQYEYHWKEKMTLLFWCLTAIFSLIALVFILPGLKNRSTQKLITILFLSSIYIFYLHMGYAKQLTYYYSENQIKARKMQETMRPLFAEMKKQQGRLKLKIVEDQNDSFSKALLLELLGVESLYHEEKNAAVEYWDAALSLLNEDKSKQLSEIENVRQRILFLKQRTTNE